MKTTRFFFAALLLLPAALFAAPDYAWLEYGPDGPIARAIVPGGGPCPSIVIDGKAQPMTLRAPSSSLYDVTSCEALVAVGTASASIDGIALPVAKLGKASKIALIGDTGCRLKVSSSGGSPSIQNCSDPAAWPFAANAQSVASWNPDLVIEVGDYYYREAMQDKKGNWVKAPYDWKRWEADFFKPADPLLRNAPWIVIRGNHEMCGRAAEGWFRFLDPNRYSWEGAKHCTSNLNYTPPYVVTVGAQSFAVFDSSAANGGTPDPQQVEIYQNQLQLIAAKAPAGTWLVLHHPLWVLWGSSTGTATMYTAWTQSKPQPAVPLVVAGHSHLLETLDFTDRGVPQVIVGNGGTALDTPPTLGSGTSIGGRVVDHLYVRDDFGFIAATPSATGWTMQIMSEKGTLVTTCAATTGSFVCQ